MLAAFWAVAIYTAPDAPKIDSCEDWSLFSKDAKKLLSLIECARAYQRLNWWFVTLTFGLTYIGIKMFAIPAVFPLGILGGAIFPFPLTLSVTALGEAVGSSLCYLMSRSFAQPVLERLFPKKLALLHERAEEEREHWLLFNFFLRLTPVVCVDGPACPPATAHPPLSRPRPMSSPGPIGL